MMKIHIKPDNSNKAVIVAIVIVWLIIYALIPIYPLLQWVLILD